MLLLGRIRGGAAASRHSVRNANRSLCLGLHIEVGRDLIGIRTADCKGYGELVASSFGKERHVQELCATQCGDCCRDADHVALSPSQTQRKAAWLERSSDTLQPALGGAATPTEFQRNRNHRNVCICLWAAVCQLIRRQSPKHGRGLHSREGHQDARSAGRGNHQTFAIHALRCQDVICELFHQNPACNSDFEPRFARPPHRCHSTFTAMTTERRGCTKSYTAHRPGVVTAAGSRTSTS
mmetsp:Transcript_5350/g.20166  ORF Transcript_5350/g.20166 Transcript_5350/m.20166 type:complete len:239 (-) Transcript_5350:41-757(-)